MTTRRVRRLDARLGVASWAILAFGVVFTALSPNVENGKGGQPLVPLVALAIFFLVQVLRLAGLLGYVRRHRRLPLWVLALSIMLWAAGSTALNAGGQAALTQFPAPGEWLFIGSYVGLAGFLLLDAGRRGAHATTTWLDVAVVCGGTASLAGAFLLTPVAGQLRTERRTPAGRPALPAHRPGAGAPGRGPDHPAAARDEPAHRRALRRLPALDAGRLELRGEPLVRDLQVRFAAVRRLGRRHRPDRLERLHAATGHRHRYEAAAGPPDPADRQLDRRARPGVPPHRDGALVRRRARPCSPWSPPAAGSCVALREARGAAEAHPAGAAPTTSPSCRTGARCSAARRGPARRRARSR